MAADTHRQQALQQAANAARYAPSVHNTQPWRWVVRPDRLELYAVTDRQLPVQDPEGHLLLTSCGTALHHACIALAAAGWSYRIDRPADAPLAVLHPIELGPVDPTAIRHFEQLQVRHTDRRTVTDDPVAPAVLDDLVQVSEAAGARLHVLSRDQVIELAVLVEHAQKAEGADERLQAETAAWVGGERPAGTGIPAASLPQEVPLTTVAERDFGAAGSLPPGAGHDAAATYGVLYGPGDEPADWLRAGEALDALWLKATEHGVSLLPLSSPVEVPFTRFELRRMLGDIGYPYLVVRLGSLDPDHAGPAHTPRLPTDQVIDVVE
ncbi:Acg family FMN-binding oxidoreductase [Actinoplanes sp. NPDC049599]|uniref:Acg family FMN-binding oxidoreductase n=1 Tax=Actinoplanes sp. NPDC049599 TaxID=3363903 RepID=UPI00378D37A7